jgi:hypothetical protein
VNHTLLLPFSALDEMMEGWFFTSTPILISSVYQHRTVVCTVQSYYFCFEVFQGRRFIVRLRRIF